MLVKKPTSNQCYPMECQGFSKQNGHPVSIFYYSIFGSAHAFAQSALLIQLLTE